MKRCPDCGLMIPDSCGPCGVRSYSFHDMMFTFPHRSDGMSFYVTDVVRLILDCDLRTGRVVTSIGVCLCLGWFLFWLETLGFFW